MRCRTATVLWLGFLLVLLGAMASCSSARAEGFQYYCPMHPQVVSDKPGDCSICGMHLVAQQDAPAKPLAATPKALYVCPMHPSVSSEKPGDCTVCGMHLVRKSEAERADSDVPPGLAPVVLEDDKRAALGLTYGTAEVRRLATSIAASALVVPDETRVYRVIARADGYVDSLDIGYAGLPVRKGQAMLSIYSPSIQASQQQFVGSTITEGRRYPNATAKPTSGAVETSERDDAFRERLTYWGFGEEQIERIHKTGKVENSLIVESPAAGIVTEKTAVLGLRVSPGDPLFVVTDLSNVWAEVNVAEQDVPAIKPGLPLTLRVNALRGKSFTGKVKFFKPVLDPASRTMKVYAEVVNPNQDMKLGMLASAEIETAPVDALCVPEGALLQTGETAYVFVDEGARLIPQKVVPGRRGGGACEILGGLKAGDRVVTSATFLLDSESSLRATLASARR